MAKQKSDSTVTVKNWDFNHGSNQGTTHLGAATGPINVYLTNPLYTTPGSVSFNPAAIPDVQTTGAQPYVDLSPVAHWVWAHYDGARVIAQRTVTCKKATRRSSACAKRLSIYIAN